MTRSVAAFGGGIARRSFSRSLRAVVMARGIWAAHLPTRVVALHLGLLPYPGQAQWRARHGLWMMMAARTSRAYGQRWMRRMVGIRLG
ncbi:MAG: hypothetical protein C5S48_05540 [Candidatus Methanogaster sp.]|nr:MAG: hypothetical protein C5S48_05540 [ANME-2 cluster archaeon]